MPKVFISYRQLHDAERQRVRLFAEQLRDSGIEVVLDQFYLDAHPGGPNDGWDKWSSDRAIETEFVIIIGTESWFQCFEKTQPPGTGLGAACEADDLRHRIYEAGGVIENIRVVLFDDADSKHVPAKLKRYHRFLSPRDLSNIIRWLGGTAPTGAPPSSSPIPSTSPIPSNLPGGYIGRLFLGREEFLDQLRVSLQKQTHATAITQAPAATGISGLGGIGKTHAAVEYAHRHRGDYAALLFVSGESPDKLRASLAALCGVLHLDAGGALPPDEATRVAAAVDWLASHRGWLLIVDNVDTEEAAAALTGLLERLRTGHLLITSRLHDWVDNVESLDLSVLSPEAATDLLLQLTDKQRRKTADDAAQARTLADLLEGLPLALHQAAGYIREQRLTLAGYLALYEQEAADLLGWFKKHLIPYAGPEEVGPRPVLITWKTSFDKLDEETRFWLLVFAHFAPDPIPEFLLDSAPEAKDEIKKIHRDAKCALAQAETYSLLTRDRDQPRFKVHRLVQYILRLTASESKRAVAIGTGINLIAASEPGSPTDVRTWPHWDFLQTHGVYLVEYARDSTPTKHLSWLLGCLGQLFQTKGLYRQSEPFMLRALQVAEASLGPNHPSVATHTNNFATLLQNTNRLVEAEHLMRRALKVIEASLGPDHPEIAIYLNNLATLLQTTNQLEEAEQLMRRALQIDEASLDPNHPNVAIRLSNLANLLQATNRLVEAEPMMRRALQIDEAGYGPNSPEVATRLNNFSTLLQATNRREEAEALILRALQIDEAVYGSEHPDVARDINNLASLLYETNRRTEAEPLMRRGLQINELCYGKEHPEVARSLNNLASLLYEANQLEEAESLVRRALQIDEASYGDNHPQVATRLGNLAALLMATKRLTEAELMMRRALQIDEASHGKDHPNVAKDLNNLAQLLMATKRLTEAEPMMRRALQIDESSYGKDHPNVARDLNNLAQLLMATKRLTEAEPMMRCALQIDEASYGKEHPNAAIRLNNLAQLLMATKRLTEAEPIMRRALQINETSYGKEHPNVARDLNNLAHLLYETNRLAEAEPLIRRAFGIFVRGQGPEHSDSQAIGRNYISLLQALKVPEEEILERMMSVVAGG